MEKRKQIIIISSIIVIFLIIIVILSRISTGTHAYTIYDGSGNTLGSIPSKGAYIVDVQCNNADGEWLYAEWKLNLKNPTGGNVTCDITFTDISSTISTYYLSNVVKGLSNSDGVYQENGYRYEGPNPNNYVKFNNELWRIIGAFDGTNDHGQTGTLVKLIREDSIGGYVWKTETGDNTWNNATLRSLLNGPYYDWETNKGTASSYCYQYASTVPVNCDFSSGGISDAYRGYIQTVNWYWVRAAISLTADNMYTAERGTNSSYTDKGNVSNKIGLMYASDYGYSVLSSSCARTKVMSSYINSACGGSSWLSGKGSQWTIVSSSSNANYALFVLNSGDLSHNGVTVGYGTRPVLYLKSNVYKAGGTGTKSDPYIVACTNCVED